MAITLCPKCQAEVFYKGKHNRIVDTSTVRVAKPASYEVLEIYECIECKRMWYRVMDSWPIKSL